MMDTDRVPGASALAGVVADPRRFTTELAH
jgi:hypothetical protein